MTFTSHLKFSGEIQREALEDALEAALVRHPLLRALIKPAKGGRLCWVSAGAQKPSVHWGHVGDPFQFIEGESIDLTSEVGLRIWVRTSVEASEVLLQFHHSCCDGTGAYRFIGDLLAEYGLRTAAGSDEPVVEYCDLRLLKERRGKMSSLVAYGSVTAATKRAIQLGWSVFGKKIAPLAVPNHEEVEPNYSNEFATTPFPGVETLVFTKSQYKALRDAASQAGAMFNDLLVSEMLVAMADWNKVHGSNRKEWLRIMMPTDLREKADIEMPAANMTAYSFVTRSSSECANPTTLLQGVREETLRIKREKPGKRFIDAVMIGSRVPGLLKFLLGRQRCLATVILSNVGDPSRRFLSRFPREGGKVRCGNVRLEHITGVPPLRPLSRATLSIVTYGREFAINLRCDPSLISRDDARKFLELYASRLASHLPHELTPSANETVAVR